MTDVNDCKQEIIEEANDLIKRMDKCYRHSPAHLRGVLVDNHTLELIHRFLKYIDKTIDDVLMEVNIQQGRESTKRMNETMGMLLSGEMNLQNVDGEDK